MIEALFVFVYRTLIETILYWMMPPSKDKHIYLIACPTFIWEKD